MFYAIVKSLVVWVMRRLFTIEGHGLEHVPRSGPVLLVANHSSVLDPPLIGGIVPRRMSFMAKAELFRIPVFGAAISRLGARPIRRGGGDAGALRTSLRILREGGMLLVFPEGTRGPEGVLREPKGGAGMLAALSGAAVVPVYVRGSGRVWPRGQRLPRPGRIDVTFGPPLAFAAPHGEDRKARYDLASREMMTAIARLRDGGRSEVGEYIHGRKGLHGEG